MATDLRIDWHSPAVCLERALASNSAHGLDRGACLTGAGNGRAVRGAERESDSADLSHL